MASARVALLLSTSEAFFWHGCADSCIPVCFVCHKDTKLKVSFQCFCPQDESVTQLGQELAQKLGLRVRKAYKRPQVWLLYFLYFLFFLETILWLFQIYFCKSGRCTIDTGVLPCNPPSRPLAPLLILPLWLTFTFVHFWPYCCPGSSPGRSLHLQQSQTGAAGEGSNVVGACTSMKRGTCGLIPKEILIHIPSPVTGMWLIHIWSDARKESSKN